MDSMNGSLLSEGIVYCTALYLAAQNGHRDVVKYISELNLAPPSEEMLRCTALYFAAQHGQLETVRAITTSLIAGKVNRNDDKKILQKSKIHTLLKVDVNSQDMKGNSALHYAAMEGNADLIKKIISKGAIIDIQNVDFESALHHAVQNEHTNVVHLLLKNNSYADCKDKLGNTPIHYAVEKNYSDIVKLLLEYGANLNIANIDKKLPLDYLKSVDVFNVILNYCKNMNVKDSFRNNLLHIAVKRGFITAIGKCIKIGIDINSFNFVGDSALHIASEKGDIKIVKELLKQDVNLFAKNFNGNLPIHVSSKFGHYDIVKLFLDNGIAIDCKYLFIAVENNHAEFVKLLLNTCVYKDNDIIQAFIFAIENRFDGIMDMLLWNVKDVNVINNLNVFTTICKAGYENLVKILLSKGADTKTTRYETSPLIAAIKGGYVNTVKLILQHQKDNNISYGRNFIERFSVYTDDKNIKKLLQDYL